MLYKRKRVFNIINCKFCRKVVLTEVKDIYMTGHPRGDYMK